MSELNHYAQARRHVAEASRGPSPEVEDSHLAYAAVEALLYIGEQLEVLAGVFGEAREGAAHGTERARFESRRAGT